MTRLHAADDGVRTHPYARVETDGSPENTTVVLVGPDGDEIDVTRLCTSVKKDADHPLIAVTMLVLAPREHLHGEPDELDRGFEVSV